MSAVNPRGTSNSNSRGSAAGRRERKLWMLSPAAGFGGSGFVVPCFRADTHCQNHALTYESMQVDRIRPGILHGRYVRTNIRPCCQPCNFALGIELREKIRRGEILIVSREAKNIVLFKDGREWVASAQHHGRIIAEARSTSRVNAFAELTVALLDQIPVTEIPVEEERQPS